MDEASSTPAKANLFTLPRELRDRIYEYACEDVNTRINFVETIASMSTLDLRYRPRGPVGWRLASHDANIGILQVCSQMRLEATPIYFRHTTFTFSGINACIDWLKNHIHTEHITQLRQLRVQESGNYCPIWDLRREMSHDPSYSPRPTDASHKRHLARTIRSEASHRLTTLMEGLDYRERSRIREGALQAMVVNKDWEFVWTATPRSVEIPS